MKSLAITAPRARPAGNAYRKVVRLGVTVPPTRPFTSDWFIATNAWTRWKDLPAKLADIFGD